MVAPAARARAAQNVPGLDRLDLGQREIRVEGRRAGSDDDRVRREGGDALHVGVGAESDLDAGGPEQPVVVARKRAGEKVACQPSRFIAELAQEDLRYSNAPLTQAEAAQEKVAGNARLQSLKAILSR